MDLDIENKIPKKKERFLVKYNVEEMTKNDKKIYLFIYHSIKYSIYNLIITIIYGIKWSWLALIMMVLQVTKTFPVALHLYFSKRYDIVLSKDLLNNMSIEYKNED